MIDAHKYTLALFLNRVLMPIRLYVVITFVHFCDISQIISWIILIFDIRLSDHVTKIPDAVSSKLSRDISQINSWIILIFAIRLSDHVTKIPDAVRSKLSQCQNGVNWATFAVIHFC